jgi:hypothetical protein
MTASTAIQRGGENGAGACSLLGPPDRIFHILGKRICPLPKGIAYGNAG